MPTPKPIMPTPKPNKTHETVDDMNPPAAVVDAALAAAEQPATGAVNIEAETQLSQSHAQAPEPAAQSTIASRPVAEGDVGGDDNDFLAGITSKITTNTTLLTTLQTRVTAAEEVSKKPALTRTPADAADALALLQELTSNPNEVIKAQIIELETITAEQQRLAGLLQADVDNITARITGVEARKTAELAAINDAMVSDYILGRLQKFPPSAEVTRATNLIKDVAAEGLAKKLRTQTLETINSDDDGEQVLQKQVSDIIALVTPFLFGKDVMKMLNEEVNPPYIDKATGRTLDKGDYTKQLIDTVSKAADIVLDRYFNDLLTARENTYNSEPAQAARAALLTQKTGEAVAATWNPTGVGESLDDIDEIISLDAERAAVTEDSLRAKHDSEQRSRTYMRDQLKKQVIEALEIAFVYSRKGLHQDLVGIMDGLQDKAEQELKAAIEAQYTGENGRITLLQAQKVLLNEQASSMETLAEATQTLINNAPKKLDSETVYNGIASAFALLHTEASKVYDNTRNTAKAELEPALVQAAEVAAKEEKSDADGLNAAVEEAKDRAAFRAVAKVATLYGPKNLYTQEGAPAVLQAIATNGMQAIHAKQLKLFGELAEKAKAAKAAPTPSAPADSTTPGEQPKGLPAAIL